MVWQLSIGDLSVQGPLEFGLFSSDPFTFSGGVTQYYYNPFGGFFDNFDLTSDFAVGEIAIEEYSNDSTNLTSTFVSFQTTAVPEPSSLVLGISAAVTAVVVAAARRKRADKSGHGVGSA